MEISDLVNFKTVACAAAAVDTGLLSIEDEGLARRVAGAYFHLHHGDLTELGLVTREVAELQRQRKLHFPEADRSLNVIEATIKFCREVLSKETPQDHEYKRAA